PRSPTNYSTWSEFVQSRFSYASNGSGETARGFFDQGLDAAIVAASTYPSNYEQVYAAAHELIGHSSESIKVVFVRCDDGTIYSWRPALRPNAIDEARATVLAGHF